MSRILTRFVLAGVLLAGPTLGSPRPGFAQQAPGPTFEVAAINPAAPLDIARIASAGDLSNLRIGMNVTDTRVDINYMSLANLMPFVFSVQPYQVSAPDWLNEQRFDIRATYPPGATKEQVPDMLRALLVERFGMVFHRESREMPVYSLVAGKDGARLKEAEPLPDAPPAEPAPGEVVVGTGDNQMRMTRSGTTPGNASMTIATNRTSMNVKMGDNGAIHLDVSRMTMAEFAQLLTSLAGRPVLDDTGMNGTYQLKLELAMTDLLNAARASGVAGMFGGLPGAGGAAVGGALPAAGASDPGGSSIFESVQKLGLKLESKRAPVEVVVIDRMERNPTAN